MREKEPRRSSELRELSKRCQKKSNSEPKAVIAASKAWGQDTGPAKPRN